MRVSTHRAVGRPDRHGKPNQASARTTVLMLVLFLLGTAVGALWVYRSLQQASTKGEAAERTLAESTIAVLKNLKSPLEIQFYAIFGEGVSSGDLREFTGRVNQLLVEFQQEAGGKINVTPHDAWNDANTRRAAAAGVVPFSVGGDPAYVGLVVVQDGRKEALAQIRPEWEAALEFDLARAIARVTTPTSTPASAADTAMAENAAAEVQRSIPNLGSVSLDEGKRILREAALEEYMSTVLEMEKEIAEAQQRVTKAEAAQSDSDRQSALEKLRQVRAKHAEKLSQIAARSQAQIEALQRMKD